MGLAHYSAQMLSHVLIFTAHNMHAHKMSTLVEVLRWGLVAAASSMDWWLPTVTCSVASPSYPLQSAV